MIAPRVYPVWITGQKVVLFERQPHAASEFTDRCILQRRSRLEDDGEDQFRPFDRVNSKYLRIGQEHAPEFFAVANVHGEASEHLRYLVGVCREVDADVYR